jgi:hypothetical protein
MRTLKWWILNFFFLTITLNCIAQEKAREWDVETRPLLVISTKRTMNPGNDTRHNPDDDRNRDKVEDSVANFSHYFDDRLLDVFWQEFRKISLRTDADAQYSSDHIIRYDQVGKSYGYLFKIMYGDSFELIPQSKYVIRDTVKHTQSAEVLFKAGSRKARGYIDIGFAIANDRSITLQRFNFYPFDHSPNAFLANLSENDLNLINTQQASAVIDSASHYADPEQLKLMKGIRKKLDGIKIPANSLFTSRLFMEKGDVWVMGVFDTDKASVHLSIAYKLVNKKFKPAFIEVLKKD